MEQLIIVAHVVAALAIIALILIQQGRGADMGASFGAGSSQTVFGPAGSGNVLTKATAGLAALFFATSFEVSAISVIYSEPRNTKWNSFDELFNKFRACNGVVDRLRLATAWLASGQSNAPNTASCSCRTLNM